MGNQVNRQELPMARSFNQVTLIGNLTRDPEVRAIPSGDEVCRFSLALNYGYTTSDGETHEGVDFVDISAWGGLASIVKTYCHKGKQILVSGRLKSSSWEQDGQTRSKLEVRADNILLLGNTPASSNEAKPKPTPKKKTSQEAVDYEVEDFDYDQEEIDPQDIPF
ncbi:MAG: single-stranded DNA-binding protein [Candidatus Saccharibacteria bacterium]|nr:single-stranded DNA-binding protein [Candidatus Saccharibacteria bacterium]